MPPLLSRLISYLRSAIEGYEHPVLVETMYRRTLAYHPVRFNPDAADAETILDFGGGFGAHEKECYISTTTKWAIVETPAVCTMAARVLETSHLRWFPTIPEAAAWLGPIDLIHCNGALQYSPTPFVDLVELLRLRPKRILWRRMALIKGPDSVRTIQTSYLCDNGPQSTTYSGPHLRVRYPITYLPKKLFMDAHALHYTLTSCTNDSFDFSRKPSP